MRTRVRNVVKSKGGCIDTKVHLNVWTVHLLSKIIKKIVSRRPYLRQSKTKKAFQKIKRKLTLPIK